MISPLIEEQFSEFRDSRTRNGATEPELIASADGSVIVVVPDVRLPAGWSVPKTTVRFVLPVGYPLARPDCFWTDRDLRLIHGGLPMNTGHNGVYNQSHLTWFSWHPATWDPNYDTINTYFRMIERRLYDAR